MTKHLRLEPAKHEEAAICKANLRIPNVYRIAGIALAMEQFADIISQQWEIFPCEEASKMRFANGAAWREDEVGTR